MLGAMFVVESLYHPITLSQPLIALKILKLQGMYNQGLLIYGTTYIHHKLLSLAILVMCLCEVPMHTVLEIAKIGLPEKSDLFCQNECAKCFIAVHK